MPDLPTVAETVPGFKTSVWFGLWGPAKMPPALLAKIQADVSKALELPETKHFFKTNSFERVDLSPQEFGKLDSKRSEALERLIKSVGAKMN